MSAYTVRSTVRQLGCQVMNNQELSWWVAPCSYGECSTQLHGCTWLDIADVWFLGAAVPLASCALWLCLDHTHMIHSTEDCNVGYLYHLIQH